MVLVCSIPWLYFVKNCQKGYVYEGGKVGMSSAIPTIFFSVDPYNLKSMSFKFGNDTIITFEIPNVAYNRSFSEKQHFVATSSINNQRALVFKCDELASHL